MATASATPPILPVQPLARSKATVTRIAEGSRPAHLKSSCENNDSAVFIWLRCTGVATYTDLITLLSCVCS
eukprot:2222543-Pleurochrysis_carterae.AAC.1